MEGLYYNIFFAIKTSSRLHETELLLDMIGNQLLDNDRHLDREKSQAVMANMSTRFPGVVGFSLTDPEGNYMAMSSRADLSNIKGLKKNDKTIVAPVFLCVFLIPFSKFIAHYLVNRDFKMINDFCRSVKNGSHEVSFDLPHQKEEEDDLIILLRNLNWMSRILEIKYLRCLLQKV